MYIKQMTSERKKGVSYNYLTNQWYLKAKAEDVKAFTIGDQKATTAAQAMTLIGYGEMNSLPVRSLDYCVRCEDFKDLAECIKIINSYNKFEADRIIRAARWILNLKHFLNENNGNNGKAFFDFHIAREGSPAFYVSYNEYFHNKVITDTEEVEATETEPAKTLIYWEEYTGEDFKANMKELSKQIGADEFDISVEAEVYGKPCYKARFWFD